MSIDRRQVAQFVKNVLKGGTPPWVSHPEDYKAYADEWHREARESLLHECSFYQVDDQALLSDPAGRRVNPMLAAMFMRNLRNAGLTCFSHDSQLKDGTASLFALTATPEGGRFQPICSIQVPIMWEWSLLRIDPKTNLPSGFRDIGWRSAVRCLIEKGVFTEERAHEIFGKPREASVSRVYRRMLCEHRNGGKRYAA